MVLPAFEDKIIWWGYVHENGSIQVKRYWDKGDIDEAMESPFCKTIIQPFPCDNRDKAIEFIKEQVGI